MSAAKENMATKQPQFRFDFALANFAASQTDTDVPILGGIIPEFLLPAGGKIVGYAVNLSAAVTAGSLAFDITIDGTSVKTIDADTATQTEYYAAIEDSNLAFDAGNEIGCTYTSDGSLAPTTIDGVVSVYIVFDEWNW